MVQTRKCGSDNVLSARLPKSEVNLNAGSGRLLRDYRHRAETGTAQLRNSCRSGRLCLISRRGFASRDKGNPTTMDNEIARLSPVVRLATEIRGGVLSAPEFVLPAG